MEGPDGRLSNTPDYQAHLDADHFNSLKAVNWGGVATDLLKIVGVGTGAIAKGVIDKSPPSPPTTGGVAAGIIGLLGAGLTEWGELTKEDKNDKRCKYGKF